MKQALWSLFVISFFLLFAGCKQSIGQEPNEYSIVPLPNKLTPQEGRFSLSNKVTVNASACSPEVQHLADSLIARIKKISGITLKAVDKEESGTPGITFIQTEGMPKEGYKLSITPQSVVLSATEANGFFYGIQTLYQLLPPAIYGNETAKKEKWSLPAVEIEDAPTFRYRGLMLDVCRHFSPVSYIYKFIDMLAMHKMNTFHWHLTDDQGWRIEIKKYPKLTEIGSKRKETLVDYYYTNWPQVFDGKEHSGYYTQEEIKDIVAYAASKYITVIPEIEMPGHASAALASYPELSCNPDTTYNVQGLWGVFEEVYCPKENTFKFQEGVLDEIVELFPNSYIHVGGDECPKTAWKNCPHCQGLIKELGLTDDKVPNATDGKKHTKEDKLQSYFITRMEKYLNSKGRNIIGWDEILEGGLAPNATVMSWRGIEGGINAAKLGHDAVMTPQTYVYLDYYQEDPSIAPITIGGYNTLKKVYSYNPIPDDADDNLKKHVIGVQGNIWTEYMQNEERRDYQAYPRAVAIAETGWTQKENKNWNSFCQRMVKDFERMDTKGVNACRNFFDAQIDTHVFNDTLKVVLTSYYPDAEIRYTLDGSTPTAKSTLYTQPFAWKGHINLKAAAFKGDQLLGKVSEKDLYASLIAGKQYTTIPEKGWMTGDIFGENDVLGADSTTLGLTNGKRGYITSYTPWVSFGLNDYCNNEVVFTVDLGKTTAVSSVVFGTLYNPAFRVLPASAIIVEVSMDGKEYQSIAKATYERKFPERGRKAFTDRLSFNPTETRYVKLTLKSGGTLRNGVDCKRDSPEDILPSDMYIDEIEIY